MRMLHHVAQRLRLKLQHLQHRQSLLVHKCWQGNEL